MYPLTEDIKKEIISLNDKLQSIVKDLKNNPEASLMELGKKYNVSKQYICLVKHCMGNTSSNELLDKFADILNILSIPVVIRNFFEQYNITTVSELITTYTSGDLLKYAIAYGKLTLYRWEMIDTVCRTLIAKEK